MSNYNNLPGVNMELLDGNLRVDEVPQGNAVLIVGRAISGPSNMQYEVTDTNKASRLFGAASPIIKKMDQARLGGASRIILYRVGGAPASINGIFGEDSFIMTNSETVTSGDMYSIYIGERPTNDGKACVIAFKDNKIVYSNVPGSEIDLQEIVVQGFDPDTQVKVGSPDKPVLMSEVILSEKALELDLASATGTEFALPGTTVGDTVVIKSVEINGAQVPVAGVTIQNTASQDSKTAKFSGSSPSAQSLKIKYTVMPSRAIEASFAATGDGTQVEFPIPDAKLADTVFIKSVFAAGVELENGSDFEIVDTADGKAISCVVAPAQGAVVVAEYVVYQVGQNPEGDYTPGEDNLDSTWEKYFELLHSGFADLDVVDAFAVVTDAAIMDAPNIASGATGSNILRYVSVKEEDGIYKYSWSDSPIEYKKGLGTTLELSEADLNGNGQPIIAKEYHEANFAHLLATFAHNISENERFCLAVIGTSAPRSMTTYDVSKWVGTPGAYDKHGILQVNGSGLLGARNMVERLESRQGFYKTASGFVDGAVEFDSNGAPIDIGKYLSVVASVIYTGISGSMGTDGRLTNGAAVYAGLLCTINPGDSTTNVAVPRISLPFDVKKTKLDELAGAGYVMFQSKTRGTTVVSGELATNINSDYDYVSTTIIVSDAITRIRRIAENFIGKGLGEDTTAALETAVESEFQKMVDAGSVNKYLFNISTGRPVNGKGVVDIQITIVPPFELREVNVAIKLAMDL